MKKFSFEAPIISRRRIRKRNIFYGLIAAALFGYMGISYLDAGVVPVLEKMIGQLGLEAYSSWIYPGVFALLIFCMIPALYTLFRKKTIRGGQVSFDEANLRIVKGSEKYVIPENELREIQFELKPLSQKVGKKTGGNWMKIPTQKGIFECELEIDRPEQKEQLLEMAEFLKIEHDVKVKVLEQKK